MLTIYDRIWADAIAHERNKKRKESAWKLFTLISISMLQGLNLLALLFIFRWLTHGKMPILLPVHIFNKAALNSFCSIFLVFFIPFVILNYLLIFYNNRYELLLKQYSGNGKLYRNYFIFSVGIIAVPVVLKFIFL